MDVQFDQGYNGGVVQAVPINVYDYYEPGEIKHFSWMKLFVPRGGKCQFAIKVSNFDGEIPIDMLLLLLLFFCHCRRVVYQVLRARYKEQPFDFRCVRREIL